MGIAEYYLDAQRSFVEFVSTFDETDWAAPVACTPGWTARDVLSHVAGVTIDISEGNTHGAATAPWTAAQVERFRDEPIGALLDRWADEIDAVAHLMEAVGEARPAIDCHTHEHDVRHALGRPGNRESTVMQWAGSRFAGAAIGRPVTVELPDGGGYRIVGEGDDLVLRDRTVFEIVRSRLGRRSRAQVVGWDWSEAPDPAELGEWFVFGPADTDIDE